jgi:hypothetical protein
MNGNGFGRGYRGFPGGGPGFGGGGFGPRGMMGRHVLFPGGGIFFLLMAVAVSALVVFLFWRILRKAGYEGALSLLMLVPFVNIGLLVYLAFEEWPVLKELHKWRLAYAQTAAPAVPAGPAAPTTPMPAQPETVIVPTAPMGTTEPVTPTEPPAPDAPDASSAPTQPIEPPTKPRKPKAQ